MSQINAPALHADAEPLTPQARPQVWPWIACLWLGLAVFGLEAATAPPEATGMTWWQAAVLGVVEGVTEYLPVSSTGHLLIAQQLMGVGVESAASREAANAFAICIQAGAILAVLGLYWQRVRQACVGWAGRIKVGPGDDVGFRLGLNLLLAFMPAAVIGLLLDDWIEARLFGTWPIVIAWFVGGVAILLVSYRRRRIGSDHARNLTLEGLTPWMAVGIGLMQCLAMWPGTSRSLVTIVGGVLLGLSLAAAVEFSFLLGVITLCAATVYKAKDAGPLMVETYGWGPMILGSVAAWLSAVIAVRWMVAYLQDHGMQVFGYYRIGIAVVVAAWLLTQN